MVAAVVILAQTHDGGNRGYGVDPASTRPTMNLMTRVKHELSEVGLVTLYFLICFGIILLLKKLFLASYEIEYYALSGAVISALIAAKIVVILDKTHAGTRFDRSQSTGIAAGYKTFMYLLVTLVFLVAERAFHAYRETGALGKALDEVWEERDRNVMLAKALCVGLTFAAYNLYAGVDRRLGKGVLWRAIWNRTPPPDDLAAHDSPKATHERARSG
jgi:hypothetical protein